MNHRPYGDSVSSVSSYLITSMTIIKTLSDESMRKSVTQSVLRCRTGEIIFVEVRIVSDSGLTCFSSF